MKNILYATAAVIVLSSAPALAGSRGGGGGGGGHGVPGPEAAVGLPFLIAAGVLALRRRRASHRPEA